MFSFANRQSTIVNPQSSTVNLCCALLILPVCGGAQTKTAEAKTPFIPKPAGTVRRLPAKATAKTSAEPEKSLTTVVVKAIVEVNGSHFTLGEIAEITGKDKALIAQLAAVEVGASPLPGMSRLLLPGDITVHLRAAHLGDLLDKRRLEVIAPPEMRVARAGHDVGEDEITQAALAAAQPAIKNMPHASLEAVKVNGKITVPAGKVKVIAGAYRGQPETGTITVPVSVLLDGKVVQSTDVTLHVRRKLIAVVACRTLEPHDLIGVEDVMLVLTDMPPGFSKPLLSLEEAVGKRATRRILAEAPITANSLETPPDVTANTRLTIEYVFGSIHITAPGLARQAGMIGDTIRVYAVDTHKEVEAVIVDARTVQLRETE